MQIVYQVVFFILALLIIGPAFMVVTSRNIIHAALWLIASFFGVGALYMLLHAEFLAIVQILVYVGAISILVLFAIMLTRHVTNKDEHGLYQRWWVGLFVSAGLFGAVITPVIFQHPWKAPTEATTTPTPAIAGAVELGTAFVHEYLISFQIAAVVLLIALVGAIVIAYEERSNRRRVLTLAEEVALRKQQQQG